MNVHQNWQASCQAVCKCIKYIQNSLSKLPSHHLSAYVQLPYSAQ